MFVSLSPVTRVIKNFFKWAIIVLFFVYFCLFKQPIIFLLQINVKNVMSVQYTALGSKPTMLGTRVCSHNH